MLNNICVNRPVRPAVAILPPVDIQALPPFGWCERCGGEVYSQRRSFCPRCRKGGDRRGEFPLSQPLPFLLPGKKPGSL